MLALNVQKSSPFPSGILAVGEYNFIMMREWPYVDVSSMYKNKTPSLPKHQQKTTTRQVLIFDELRFSLFIKCH
jgi:hypothetical protein